MPVQTLRVAAAQLAPVLDDGDGTVEKVLATIAQAARDGARLLVFPETFVPYYPYFSFVYPPVSIGQEHMRLYRNAPLAHGPQMDAVAACARQNSIVVVLGINERDHGSLYNAQLIFDADGTLKLKRRKITPTFHERMIWGQGDGAGLHAVDTAIGRVGALACWEHYNPLARYALMADHEEIHCSQFPGSLVGPIFSDQMEATLRHHALESGCFVVNATGWLTDAQINRIHPDPAMHKALRGGCCTAIISPEGRHLVPPLKDGEGVLMAELDMSLIIKRKRMMDSVGHYARPDLLSVSLRDLPLPALTRDAPVHAKQRSDHDGPATTEPEPIEKPDHRAAILRAAAG
jgi:aliphatic nitrilase